MSKHKSLLNLFIHNTGRTTHKERADPDIRAMSQYWRDRADLSSVPDIRRWR
jgi:hypothetical protein